MTPEHLRIATYLAPGVRETYELAALRIGEALGVPAELVVGEDPEQLARGEEHVAFLCSPPALDLADRTPAAVEILAAPVLTDERFEGRPVYASDVVVRADDPARELKDLRGRAWAYNEESSFSGYGALLAAVADAGDGPEFFGSFVRAGFHSRALRLVADAAVDAAAIDTQVLALELRDDPTLERSLRVVTQLGPVTIQPVVASTTLAPTARRRIRDVLLQLNDRPEDRAVIRETLIDRFVAMTASDYDDIRELRRSIRRSGLEQIGGASGCAPGSGRAS
ncbi:MAG: PhnD/SsuA/transferrin family substrate-binding protein [Actinomycetota bacterium]